VITDPGYPVTCISAAIRNTIPTVLPTLPPACHVCQDVHRRLRLGRSPGSCARSPSVCTMVPPLARRTIRPRAATIHVFRREASTVPVEHRSVGFTTHGCVSMPTHRMCRPMVDDGPLVSIPATIHAATGSGSATIRSKIEPMHNACRNSERARRSTRVGTGANRLGAGIRAGSSAPHSLPKLWSWCALRWLDPAALAAPAQVTSSRIAPWTSISYSISTTGGRE